MNTKVLLANIDRLIRAQATTDNALSIAAGSPDAMRNLRRYASGKLKGSWKLDTLEKVAGALGTSSWELLKPPSTVSVEEDLEERVNRIIDERFPPQKSVKKRKIR